MVLNVHTETIRLIWDGRKNGEGGTEVCVCRGGIIYLSLHCNLPIDSCVRMSSDASHFNVS